MECLKCSSNSFSRKHVRFQPEIKGQVVDVLADCFVCNLCHTSLMDPSMMNELRKAAADKYRADNGLLSSMQIKTYREALGMSQTAFAKYLNVGEASIKRWETYYIQDAGQDEHIRLKCDEAYAEMNFLDVQWKTHAPDIFSGNKKFNFQIFKNVVLFLIFEFQESILILNKLHFFIDFYHFKKYGISLTGVRYVPLKYGPCPDQYRALYECLMHTGVISGTANHKFKSVSELDLNLFDDQERETLKYIVQVYREHGGHALYDLSHRERGYTETPECAFISYEYARDLQI